MISLPEAITNMNGSARWPRGLTALSFDDGFAQVYTQALPILRRHQLSATVFLVGRRVSGPAGCFGKPARGQGRQATTTRAGR